MNNEDFKKYEEFVRKLSPDRTSNINSLVERLLEVEKETGINMARLITCSNGMLPEAGEFGDIVKKVILQGKPLDKETQENLIKELGDVMWYMTQGMMALGITIDDVIQSNIDKLSKRYPEGRFTVHRSENRRPDDV